MAQPIRSEHTKHADGGPDFERPQVIVLDRSTHRGDALDLVLRGLAAVALILVVALLSMLLLVLAPLVGQRDSVGSSVVGAGHRAADRLSADADRLSGQVESAAQTLADASDPAHPPRVALQQDTEFDALTRVAVGGNVGRTGQYVLTLAAVERRDGAVDPNQAAYAVVHRELAVPRETKVLGQVVWVDRDEADYCLYKGESFRLGQASYKVNWVSLDSHEIAVARYRQPGAETKFQLD